MKKAFIRMTDIHVNILSASHYKEWCKYVYRQANSMNAQGIIISGDISESPEVVEHLTTLHNETNLPIYFVLGNHDYWNGDVATTQQQMCRLSQSNPKITWLGQSKPIALSEKTCILGHDGWYDALAGNWREGNIYMRDWDLIQDFALLQGNKSSIIGMSRKLAGIALNYVHDQIDDAIASNFETIIIVTHVPPFAEAAYHRGQIGDVYSRPFYTSVAMGEMILEKAKQNPNKHFFVLAGHTHDEITKEISKNVTIHVGGASYGAPSFQFIYLGDNSND